MRSRLLLFGAFVALAAAPAFAQSTAATSPATSTDISKTTAEVHGVHNDVVTYGKLLGTKLDTLHTDMQALLQALQAAPASAGSTNTAGSGGSASTGSTGSTTPTVTYPGDVVTAFDPCAGMTTKWSVMKIAPSANIANALVCAAPAFTLLLEPGTYSQVFHVPDGLDGWTVGGDLANGGNADTVKVDGRGGCTVSQNNSGGCPTRLAWGKGVIHASSPGTIRDLEVRRGGSNAQGDHDGQAGIYFEAGNGGTVTIQHVMLRNNENGIFANTNATFDFVFIEDDFVGNGTDGGSHSSYISGGKSLTLNNIHDYGSNSGNDQKSRVPVVSSTDGWFKSIEGRWIEAADGAVMTIKGGTFIGNTCCQNVFGNGTESTSKGPGNTTWSGSTIWLGRASDFANAGTFTASGITLSCAAGSYAMNDHGGDLTGFPSCPANSNTSAPADAPYISGAKS